MVIPMYVSLTDILLLTSIVQSLALAVFLLLPENIRLVSNQLLAATLVSFAAGLTDFFLYGAGLAVKYPALAYVGTLVGLLQAGTLYLYARSLMFRDFRLRPKHAVHTLLFWVVTVIFVVEYYLQPTDVKLQILLRRDHPGVLTSPLLAVAIHAAVLGYLYAAIRAIDRYGAGIRWIFSNVDRKELAWLRILLLGYSAVWLVNMLYCFAAHVFKHLSEAHFIVGFAGVTGFLFINYLLVHALRQPVAFAGLSAEEAALVENVETPPAGSTYDHGFKKRLERHMHEERPHLESNLTVAQLARQLSATPREVSQVINQGFHQNFFEFVSAYRIEEAKARLSDSTNTSSILEVMYDAGFNSKSVFNTAFKKATGMTPSQYREAHT